VFNAAKSFLFGRGEQFAVAHDARRRVGMVGIDPEY
jgi:DNA-binding MurR/RpiR family transcriptional regulator